MYLLQAGGAGKVRVTLMGSGTILREVIAAADILSRDFGIPSDIYSAPSFSELRREAIEIERWNRLHPGEPARKPYVKQALSKATGPFIAATDYMRAWPDMIREWVPGRFVTLGTDGFGRSDGRSALRRHFEVDAKNIVYASLHALAEEGALDKGTLRAALNKLGLDPNKLDPQKA
jgi:pyruvate dehydrogenase E1 component